MIRADEIVGWQNFVDIVCHLFICMKHGNMETVASIDQMWVDHFLKLIFFLL